MKSKKENEKEKKPQRYWPSDVRFLEHNDWDAVPLSLRQKYKVQTSKTSSTKSTPTWNKKVIAQKIEDKTHPAFGQYGLFAAVNLPPKSLIIEYRGIVKTEKDESKTSDYILRLNEELSVDAEEAGNEARFINDFRNTGKKANAFFENYFDEVTGELKMGVFVMSKAIKKGEEVLVSYGKGFWKFRATEQNQQLEETFDTDSTELEHRV